MRHNPRAVLEALAASLDPADVLARFPGLTREALRRALADALALLPRQEEEPASVAPSPPQRWPEAITAHIDGAARGNPGESGAGVLLQAGDGRVLERIARYLGRATNNTAEYQALLIALARAREVGAKRVRIFSDSELLVNQVNGRYRTSAPHLQRLLQEAIRLIREIGDVDVAHLRRELNAEADALANEAIDRHHSGR